MSKKDISSLAHDLNAIRGVVLNKKHLMTAAGFVQSSAKLLAPTGASGELRNSIQMTVVESPTRLTAHIGTNLEYALYVEFGTGKIGAANHAGVSPYVTPAYTMSSWWIHESQVDPDVPERYHWFSIDTKAGKFYQVNGQPAQPFLYPALKDNEQTIGDLLRGGWEEAIRKAT